MLKLNHKDLNVFKKSIELVSEIYRLTEYFPKTETFGLSSQMRRAAVQFLPIYQKVPQENQIKTENDFTEFPDPH